MNVLLAPFEFAFFGRALLAVIVIGALCGALGAFVLLRRLSYIGQGLSQSVLGGVAVSIALGLGLYVGAAVATVTATLLIDRVRRRRGLYADAAIGIVTLSMFAAGIAVVSANRSREFNVTNVLFGNVLGVQIDDLIVVGVVAALFFIVLATLYKPLLFTTFDSVVARSHGIRTGAMDAVFNVCLAAVVVVSLRVLGVLLIAAALIIPAATARLATRSFSVMLPLSYPFSPTPTAHLVTWDGGPTVYAMCAVDALGISTMLGHPVTITTAEPDTGEPITVVFAGATGDTCCPSVEWTCGYINVFTRRGRPRMGRSPPAGPRGGARRRHRLVHRPVG